MSNHSHLPSYRQHRQSGQAIVTLTDGLGSRKDFLLGPYGTKASRAEYNRLVAEWMANGRTFRRPQERKNDLTINELCLAYFRHAQTYYVKDGSMTSEVGVIKLALRFVSELYGDTLVREFGPLRLVAVRDAMLKHRSSRKSRVPEAVSGKPATVEKLGEGMTRKTINKQIDRLKRMFGWGVSIELVGVEVHAALQRVSGLRKGKSEAREKAPVKPVSDVWLDKTFPFLPPLIADMVRLQRLSGMRPQEVCLVRPVDIDMTADIWEYRPDRHKTEHHDRERIVFLGPKAQAIIRRNLPNSPGAYIFSPKAGEHARNLRKRAGRQTPMTPSQANRKRKRRPKLQPGDCYTTCSYRRAIARACAAADVPRWAPNQLRHATATEVRKRYGLEAAQAVLGHDQLTVTQVYAESDMDAAKMVMREIG